MGNWLENLMGKINEEERQKRAEAESRARLLAQEKVKKEEIARVEREKEMSKREEVRAGLRNILVKHKVPYLLKDVKDTVWNKGKIVEESYVSKNFCWFAIGLVHESKKTRREKHYTSRGGESGHEHSYYLGTWDVTRAHVDAVIVGVTARRDTQSFSPGSLYFRSGIIFETQLDTRMSQFSPRDREEIKNQFGFYIDRSKNTSLVSISISGKSDSNVIAELQNLLAGDSYNRRQRRQAS